VYVLWKRFHVIVFLDYTTNNISSAIGKAFARPRVVDQLAHDISLDDAVRVHCVNKELLLSKL